MGPLGIFARLSWANFRRHRMRWALTTFGVAIGVASFTGVLAISRSIMNSFEQSVVRTAGTAQLQVSNGSAGVDASLIDVIATVPGVEVASGTVQFSVAVPELDRRMTVFGVLFGADHSYREAQFGGEVLQLPDSLKFLYEIDSIALPQALLEEQGWSHGSEIEVLGPKGLRKLVVRGTVRAEGALRIFGGDLGVMDSDAAQHAFGELDRYHWVDVVVRPEAEVEAVRAILEEVVAGRAVVDTPFGRGRRMEAMLSTLRWMLTLSGIVAMLVGAFLIQHTVATAIRQRHDDLTKLRALGAGRKLVVAYLLVESFAVASIGTLVGIGVGLGFAMLASRPFGDAIATMYVPMPIPDLMLTAGELGAALAVGIGTVLAAALVPSFGILRLRPLERRGVVQVPKARMPMAVAGSLCIGLGFFCASICGTLGFAGGIAAFGMFIGLVFLGTTLIVPAFLALLSPVLNPLLRRGWGLLGSWTWQQIRRRQLHTATTIGALAAGVAFTVGMTTLLGSYRSSFADWLDQTFSADVFVNAGSSISLLSGPTIDPALQSELRQIEGVTRVMPWRLLEVEFRGRPVIVQGMAEALIDRAHRDVELDHGAGDVVISDTLAERYSLDVGQQIALPAPIRPLRVTIRAVVADYALDLGNVKIGWKSFVEHFGEQRANILGLEVAPAVSPRDLKRRIEAIAAGRYDVSVLTGAELQTVIDRLLDQSFALTYWLQMLAVVVTVLAMVNATSATIIDRFSDLATLRALGLERRRVVRLLVVEAGLLGATSGVLGVLAGALVGVTLVRVVAPAVAGFRMNLEWSPLTLATLIVLTTAAAAASALVVSRAQTRRSIVPVGRGT